MLSKRSVPEGVSMYRWVAEQLRNEIMEEKWEKGSSFLSETQIIEKYQVSRATARRAMDVLEEDGLIERIQGAGTFVSSPMIEQSLDDFHSFAYDAEKEGRRVSFKILSLEQISCNKALSKVFGLPEGTDLWRIERIKYIDQIPCIFDRIFIPVKYVPNLEISELGRSWLIELLREQGFCFTKVKKFIEPVIIGDYEAKYLEVHYRAQGLLVDRITSSNKDVIIITRSIIRSDIMRYSVDIEDKNIDYDIDNL